MFSPILWLATSFSQMFNNHFKKILFFLFEVVVLKARSHYVALAGLELFEFELTEICLTLPSMCWD